MSEFNQTKFRELILYIAKKSEDDPRFGVVKLNKILYYSDFGTYRRLGEPITHATYQKLNEGPAPREMLLVRRMMLDTGDIEIEYRPYFDHVQQRIKACRKPDVNVFSSEELAIVNEVIAELWALSGRAVSDKSHTELGWIAACPGEIIPYETAWLSNERVPQEVEEYVHEVARSIGR